MCQKEGDYGEVVRASMSGENRSPSELVRRSPERLITDETPPMLFVHPAMTGWFYLRTQA